MPLIEIKVFENEFSHQQHTGIIEAVTDAMVSFTGESIRPHTWVVLEEIKSGNWGIGGSALGLTDVRALQAPALTAPRRRPAPAEGPRRERAGTADRVLRPGTATRSPTSAVRDRRDEKDADMTTSASDDRPRKIYNPVQRDAATFLETSEETGGARTLAELEVAPGGKVTPHYHLTYSERFQVLEGHLTVDIDGVHHELKPGDEAVAAARSVHAWSNPGEERSVVHVELRPGSPGFENGLRVAYGLAADGLVRKNGVPRNPLHAALVLQMGEVRLPGGYAALDRVLGLLAFVARWRGIDRELERRYL